MADQQALMTIFDLLLAHYGPRHWWPAKTRLEVCVGAILTQNTAWGNVEKALAQLEHAGLMTLEGLRDVELDRLELLIRPSGFFRVKSRRLKAFVEWFCERCQGDFERMRAIDWRHLRDELLAVRGIGPETCDAILLYAGDKPTFVVDSYTRRLMHRVGYLREAAGYDETRSMFMDSLPPDAVLFNEYHALIVEQCKQCCRKTPRCGVCPLVALCSFAKTCKK